MFHHIFSKGFGFAITFTAKDNSISSTLITFVM
nr:MAG TPA: hypothetical protein [Caudoviricetes sp.]